MLKTADGNWISSKEDIQQEWIKHFTHIYQGAQLDDGYLGELSTIQNLIPHISDEQQHSLAKQLLLKKSGSWCSKWEVSKPPARMEYPLCFIKNIGQWWEKISGKQFLTSSLRDISCSSGIKRISV